MGDKLYKYIEAGLLKKGEIYMPTDEIPSSEETKTYTESKEKSSTEKKYDEMTLEEKLAYLEHEREILTGQSRTTIVTQSIEEYSTDRFNQEQQEPALIKTMNPKQK